MLTYFIAAVTGWAAALLLTIEIALPYLLRRTALRRAPGLAPPANAGYLHRLGPHYWLGYGLLAFAFAHASFLMGPAMARTSPTGLLAASAAIVLLFLQAMLGVTLQNAVSWNRRLIRKLHFSTMVVLTALVAIHLALN